MRIIDGYWMDYEKNDVVDRKTAFPTLNENLVRRINGRNGGPPTPFNWKGKTLYESNNLPFPEERTVVKSPEEKLVTCSSSSLAAIYHRDQCLPNTSYSCSVNCDGLNVHISNADLSDTVRERCSYSVQFGVAMDLLFTQIGEITEDAEVIKDKIAYFCVFERKIGDTLLHVRKEIDFLIPLNDGLKMPVEMKTRTRLGMNKMEFICHLLPKLLTRCYLTDFYTVMIALREDKSTSSVSKVMFIEDIRDLAGPEFNRRMKFFKFFVNRLYKCPTDVTELRFSQEELHFFNGETDLLGNIASQFFIPQTYIKGGGRPDLVYSLDPELKNLRPTLCDMCVEKKWPKKQSWRLSDKTSGVLFVAWRFQSLLDVLRTHEKRQCRRNTFHVFLCSEENPPSNEEVEFVIQFHIGDMINVEVHHFKDLKELEVLLAQWDLFENCDHAMVLLGKNRPLPDCFAIRCTDVFHINTFPLPVIIDLVTIPEKIAVFATESECLIAAEKLRNLSFLGDINEKVFFFILDKAVCSAIPLNNVFCVTSENELRDILKDLNFPVVA